MVFERGINLALRLSDNDLHRIEWICAEYSSHDSSAELAVFAEDLHELGDLFLTRLFVAAAEGVGDAVFEVAFEDDGAGFFQCSGCGGNLRENIDAVFVFLDHPGDGRDLAFGTTEPFSDVGFVVVAEHGFTFKPLRTAKLCDPRWRRIPPGGAQGDPETMAAGQLTRSEAAGRWRSLTRSTGS